MIRMVSISVLAYLLGSIPSSVWLGKWLRGTDLRNHGSGNAGATNAFRVLGPRIGIAVLAADVLKGSAAVSLARFQHLVPPGNEYWQILRIALAILAVAGHLFPVFAGFKGGKGVATMAGAALVIHPLAALGSIGVYLVAYAVFRLSALGSLLAALSYPVWMILVFRTGSVSLAVFSVIVPILLMVTHRSNIGRMMRGREKPVHNR